MFINSDELETKEPRAGWRGRFFHSPTMTFAYYTVHAGASIHAHSHANDEVWHVIEGQLEITIGGETRLAGPGCAAVVPPRTVHSVKAVTKARAIVVDHPRRFAIGGIDLRVAVERNRTTRSQPRRRAATTRRPVTKR